MDAVIIGVPDSVIAERQRLGLDKHDEVWDGEYHMVPAASGEHQRVIFRLAMAWFPLVEAAGLEIRHEWNLIPIGEPGWNDFRVPDLVVCRPDVYDERGAIGPASLVVEVRSPGDESFLKLPFFERLGVGEALIIDRDTKTVRRWALVGGRLEEVRADPRGRHALDCLPVELWTDDEVLVVESAGASTRI